MPKSDGMSIKRFPISQMFAKLSAKGLARSALKKSHESIRSIWSCTKVQRIAWKYGLYSNSQSDMINENLWLLNLALLGFNWLLIHCGRTSNSATWSNAVVRARLLQKHFFRTFSQMFIKICKIFAFHLWNDHDAVLSTPFELIFTWKLYQKWAK